MTRRQVSNISADTQRCHMINMALQQIQINDLCKRTVFKKMATERSGYF